MNSVSSETCIFPYIECLISQPNIWFLTFRLPAPYVANLYIAWLPPHPRPHQPPAMSLKQFSQSYWDSAFQAQSPKHSHQIKQLYHQLWLYFLMNSFGDQHEGTQSRFLSSTWTLWETRAMVLTKAACTHPLPLEFRTDLSKSLLVFGFPILAAILSFLFGGI